MTEKRLEAPDADAAEQEQDAVPTADEPDDGLDSRAQRREPPLEVDPADAAEQDREVGDSDDDYR
jgi:hypothetical protein